MYDDGIVVEFSLTEYFIYSTVYLFYMYVCRICCVYFALKEQQHLSDIYISFHIHNFFFSFSRSAIKSAGILFFVYCLDEAILNAIVFIISTLYWQTHLCCRFYSLAFFCFFVLFRVCVSYFFLLLFIDGNVWSVQCLLESSIYILLHTFYPIIYKQIIRILVWLQLDFVFFLSFFLSPSQNRNKVLLDNFKVSTLLSIYRNFIWLNYFRTVYMRLDFYFSTKTKIVQSNEDWN